MDNIKISLKTGEEKLFAKGTTLYDISQSFNLGEKVLAAKINNEIVGFSGVLLVLDVAEITNIVVKKNHRNKRNWNLTFKKYDFFL